MTDNAGAIFILNTAVEKADKLSQVPIPSNGVVYEVIRIINKVPLFFEEHYARLKSSLALIGQELNVTQTELKQQIGRLTEECGLDNFNVKLVIYSDGNGQNLLIYINRTYYPLKEEIEKGAVVSLLQLERDRPNAKLVNSEYKEKVTEKLKLEGTFEVLLINRGGRITEGSRSNVFFVKGSKVYTAPGENVLMGVTRKYILDVCKKLGFELIITLIGKDSLQDMDGVFLSGTSIKVLPVSQVDGMKFQSASNPTIVAIRDLYDSIIDEYVKANSK